MPRSQLRVKVIVLAVLMVLLGTALGPRSAWALPTPNWEKIDPALQTLMLERPTGEFDVIVETTLPPGLSEAQLRAHRSGEDARTAASLMHRAGGKAGKALALIGGASGMLDVRAITLLSRNPRVAYISHNATVQVQDVATQVGTALASVYTRVTRAPEVWALGYTGKGVGVAVLDSGVTASNDLTQPTNRLIASVDLVDPLAPVPADPGGHGSHIAGIVAGNGYDSSSELGGAYKGVAPGANIISVRVIGANGTARLDTVIRGIEWAVNNRATYNIRVINLSLGALPSSSYQFDPLSTAVEIAWHAGLVVVASAGNIGPAAGTISTPGRDPYIITVGALDDNTTVSTGDDVMPDFSSRGPTSFDGFSKPDLVAPGRKIVSLYAPNSTLSLQLPDRLTLTVLSGKPYFRLTGTSMAAGVVSGIVALMLERNPSLTPDRVKFILTKEAQSLSGYPAESVGAGRVDAYRAVTSSQIDKANKGQRPSDSFARRIYPLIYGQQLTWRDPSLNGIDWNNLTWNNLTWNNLTWNNLIWENLTWNNLTWNNLTWNGLSEETTWNSAGQDSAGQESIPWQSVGELD